MEANKEVIRPIEWKDREDFRGREINVTRAAGASKESGGVPISDDHILCDKCDAEVDDFPCPVVDKRALCPVCRGYFHIRPGDTEYFEAKDLLEKREPPKPRINYGGRRGR